MKFKNKVVLVTGAASGIGFGIAKRFIGEGATVIGTDIDEKMLAAAAAKLGKGFDARLSDVCKVKDIQALAKKIGKDYGQLDTLVNNAAFVRFTNPEQIEEASYDAQMSVLVKGPVFLVKHTAAMLRASSNGSVVNISSAAAVLAIDNYCPYGIGKAAILKFTQDCVITVPGIRHNAILPGLIDTPILPKIYGKKATKKISTELPKILPCGRVGQPDDIARAVCFLASDDATYINGCPLFVDGGLSLLNAFSLMQG
ncbi:MAG: SDR family NAD(P)-dependent oxidoreductase [Porticoccaceae bacterium]